MTQKLAIDGGEAVRSTFLPFARPSIGEEEIQEVVETLRGGWLTTGPRTRRFEELFAAYVEVPHAVGLSSCTGALHLALLGLGIGPGDEVITTPLTFASSANTILMTGATPVFVDIDEATFNIDPELVRAAVRDRTRAVLPVHYGGLAADLDALNEIAAGHGLHVVEDAAHAAGAARQERKIGGISTATCFSFYVTKTITTGEGGMLTTRDEELAEKVRMLSLHGLSRNAWNRYGARGSWYYELLELGFKYNMTDIQAAIGLHQLARIDDFTRRRRAIAAQYFEAFSGMPELVLPPDHTRHGDHVYHLFSVRLSGRVKMARDRFIEALRAENIGTSVHFIPLHLHPYYRDRFGFERGAFPRAEQVFERIVSLPIYPDMSDADVADVVAAVRKILAADRNGAGGGG